MEDLLIVSKNRNLLKNYNGDHLYVDCIVDATSELISGKFKYLLYDISTYEFQLIKYLDHISRTIEIEIVIYSSQFCFEHIPYLSSDFIKGYISDVTLESNIKDILQIVKKGLRYIEPKVILNYLAESLRSDNMVLSGTYK